MVILLSNHCDIAWQPLIDKDHAHVSLIRVTKDPFTKEMLPQEHTEARRFLWDGLFEFCQEDLVPVHIKPEGACAWDKNLEKQLLGS